MHSYLSTAFLTMQIVQMAKAIIPCFHANMDENKMYHVGATWVSEDGLTDRHNLELRYTRNSEYLAIQGEQQLDGSWMFEEPNGTQHTISKSRYEAYMKTKKKHAEDYENLCKKAAESGVYKEVIDANPA